MDTGAPQGRDGFIDVRKAELLAALKAQGGLPPIEARRFAAFVRLLTAIIHYEALEERERLTELYVPLDPDAPPARQAADSAAFAAFEPALLTALTRGNYLEIAPDSALSRRDAQRITGLTIKCSQAGIRATRFFGRGARRQLKEVRRWFGLRREAIETETFSEVVVFVAFKSSEEMDRADHAAFKKARLGARPGSVLIKHFRNVARAELLTLHPGARPAMTAHDQVFLAAPALVGGVPIALQIGPAITVLFTVIALFFGARGALDNSELQRALAAVSGLIAVGAFVMRQWMKYERQTLKYQKQLAETVYFRNLANNGGVIDALIGDGEEQDVKEAVLAYWRLLTAQRPMTAAELDADIQQLLRDRLALRIDFEIADALAKLQRFKLVRREGEAYEAIALDAALKALDAAWDDYFSFPDAGAAAAE
ncbi:MAG: DUF3754 domain-containing protein [Hyphomonadaceae bacterium]